MSVTVSVIIASVYLSVCVVGSIKLAILAAAVRIALCVVESCCPFKNSGMPILKNTTRTAACIRPDASCLYRITVNERVSSRPICT